jgi:hypothetical protein
MDLQAGSDYLMVLKTMPVLVQEVISGSGIDSEDRVFLTLHQPHRHSLFVAAPSAGGGNSPVVQTMAVGSADIAPRRDYAVRNTFIDVLEDAAMPVLKRSNSSPPDFFETTFNQIAALPQDAASSASHVSSKTGFNPTTSSASYVSSRSQTDSSSPPDSDGASVLIAPPHQAVRYHGALGMGSREYAGALALSEVVSIQSASVRSLGALEHSQGVCKTCLFANRADHVGGMPCWKGVFCERCHERHDVVARRKAKTGRQRERMKLMIA